MARSKGPSWPVFTVPVQRSEVNNSTRFRRELVSLNHLAEREFNRGFLREVGISLQNGRTQGPCKTKPKKSRGTPVAYEKGARMNGWFSPLFHPRVAQESPTRTRGTSRPMSRPAAGEPSRRPTALDKRRAPRLSPAPSRASLPLLGPAGPRGRPRPGRAPRRDLE